MGSEDRNESEETLSPKKVRRELILYLLRNYGDLQTKDIAKVLGHNPRTIRRTLKELEESGKVEGDKLGRSYIWSQSEEEESERLLYF